jgi:hypothetical protein
MFNGALRLIALVTVVVFLSPRPAAAISMDDIIDAIDALSGPGPFASRGNVLISGLCPATMSKDKPRATITKFFGRGDAGTSKLPCFFVDFRRLVAKPKNPYNQVDATVFDIGLMWQLVHPVELGFGVTHFHFKPAGITPINEWDLTPFRFVVRPLALISKWRENKAAGALKWFTQETFRHKDLTGADFGAPQSGFSSTFEVLTSAGFILDVGDLIGK